MKRRAFLHVLAGASVLPLASVLAPAGLFSQLQDGWAKSCLDNDWNPAPRLVGVWPEDGFWDQALDRAFLAGNRTGKSQSGASQFWGRLDELEEGI